MCFTGHTHLLRKWPIACRLWRHTHWYDDTLCSLDGMKNESHHCKVSIVRGEYFKFSKKWTIKFTRDPERRHKIKCRNVNLIWRIKPEYTDHHHRPFHTHSPSLPCHMSTSITVRSFVRSFMVDSFDWPALVSGFYLFGYFFLHDLKSRFNSAACVHMLPFDTTLSCPAIVLLQVTTTDHYNIDQLTNYLNTSPRGWHRIRRVEWNGG